ncbi:copper resistance CopC family protein [Rathayibacter soli]|uniref:copper resistance CopC family protein n=1 Tax=Rathayibacter soli TaxID=3144168 RepID=UPI0027E3F2E5|nr:copper resistance protein CopC [Glaciibacter superstes]
MHSRTTRTHATHSTRRTRIFASVAAAFVACALALAPAAGASAHDYLVDSTPKADSVQTTPLKTVSLTFDDIVLDLSGNGSSALLQVTGPDGANTHFETGCPTIDGRVVSAPVALGAEGKYVVTWQVVSADGHTVSNSFGFSYQPPAGTTAAAGSQERPACGRAGSEPTPAGSAAAGANTADPTAAANAPNSTTTPTANSSSLGIIIAIAVVIIVLAVIGVIVVLVTARRRPRTPDAAGKGSGPEPDDD